MNIWFYQRSVPLNHQVVHSTTISVETNLLIHSLSKKLFGRLEHSMILAWNLIGPLQLGSRDPNSPQNILYYGL